MAGAIPSAVCHLATEEGSGEGWGEGQAWHRRRAGWRVMGGWRVRAGTGGGLIMRGGGGCSGLQCNGLPGGRLDRLLL